jgi:hypothetical protein
MTIFVTIKGKPAGLIDGYNRAMKKTRLTSSMP